MVTPASLWSSYVRTSRLVQKGKRPFRLGIYGGIGSHRYPLVGSGDTIASWPTLGWEVYMTITGSNVADARSRRFCVVRRRHLSEGRPDAAFA